DEWIYVVPLRKPQLWFVAAASLLLVICGVAFVLTYHSASSRSFMAVTYWGEPARGLAILLFPVFAMYGVCFLMFVLPADFDKVASPKGELESLLRLKKAGAFYCRHRPH